jgi:hypothetical protein
LYPGHECRALSTPFNTMRVLLSGLESCSPNDLDGEEILSRRQPKAKNGCKTSYLLWRGTKTCLASRQIVSTSLNTTYTKGQKRPSDRWLSLRPSGRWLMLSTFPLQYSGKGKRENEKIRSLA